MILYLNPFTGLAGDMLLGALLDAGASLDAVRRAVARTGLTGWRLDAEQVRTGPLTALRVRIDVDDDATERPASTLIEMAARTGLPVAEAALTAIAEAEGALHGVPPAEVHLHELGGHDTLIDIVGCAAALRDLGVTRVHSAPLPLGSGTVRTRHGVLPVPAPATLALLRGARVRGGAAGEAVTPTGAALLLAAGTAYGAPPEMELRATGYGAGTRELPDRPNVTVAMLGRPVTEPGRQIVLSTNLDDLTGEVLAHVIERALAAGAADAWITPAVMKKGRPAHVLHVLAPPESADALQSLVFAETGSLGLRRSEVEKVALPRHFETVRLYGHDVRMKHGPWGVKPEHDDLAGLAEATGRPLRELAREALDAL
ncbi:nickel pincer cofactor biosynthesis protein LarC [Microbispora sp. RL4-1S]|uniref:Pyridinium-3,5-bisthiocarboxylic acid mononucleotide nickel insertion protein n=1 Tax=Microbispora oryzae TaxID=2806554 RepID=A0A940WRN8_9ACTN|nr:nickel pincer cofactor biosynthesis protein LarC [Microbispora oryzae]MBP2708677.1 nickel pincer cofactor biosynthesis protein LarC [Microbispora oryzae]